MVSQQAVVIHSRGCCPPTRNLITPPPTCFFKSPCVLLLETEGQLLPGTKACHSIKELFGPHALPVKAALLLPQ
jgi:hypothetical protein